jgi:esterase/lipase superfamily enzyme
MGNLAVLGALQSLSISPKKQVSELILAAPDVDTDNYKQVTPKVLQISDGITLYASSHDVAIQASGKIAKHPRAGDIIHGQPCLVLGVEKICLKRLATTYLVCHDVFASNKAVIDDIGLILRGHAHPSDRMLSEIRGMPAHVSPSSFWRYAN